MSNDENNKAMQSEEQFKANFSNESENIKQSEQPKEEWLKSDSATNGGDIQSLEKDWEDLSRRETGSDLQDKTLQDELGKEAEMDQKAPLDPSVQFAEIVEQGVSFLRAYHDPHTEITIRYDGAVIMKGHSGYRSNQPLG